MNTARIGSPVKAAWSRGPSAGIVRRVEICIGLLALMAAGAVQAADRPPRDCVPDGDTTIKVGQIFHCEIEAAGDKDNFRFSAKKGDLIVLTLLDRTPGCDPVTPCPIGDLYFGTTFIDEWSGTDSKVVALESTGTYTFRVGEFGNDQTESYGVGLEKLFPAGKTTEEIDWGQLKTGETVAPIGDQDIYQFHGYKDALISISLVDLTSGCDPVTPCPIVDLWAPDYSFVAEVSGSDSIDVALPATGGYRLQAYEYGNDSTESYSLGIDCISPPDGKSTCGKVVHFTCNGLTPTIVGTSGNDDLSGTSGDDVIVGLEGDDIIDGKGGNDVICGGADDMANGGNDTLVGGDGADTLLGNDGNDILLGGDGADILRGGTGRDSLFGGAGADKLFGEDGDDVLDGGSGNDTLNGGAGSDVCQTGDSVAPTECEILDPL